MRYINPRFTLHYSISLALFARDLALRELHWLPVRHRITCKWATIVYKCLHGLALPYVADDCLPITTVTTITEIVATSCHILELKCTKFDFGKFCQS